MGEFSSLKVLHENMTSSFHCNPIPNKQTNFECYLYRTKCKLPATTKKKRLITEFKNKGTSTQGANMEKLEVMNRRTHCHFSLFSYFSVLVSFN